MASNCGHLPIRLGQGMTNLPHSAKAAHSKRPANQRGSQMRPNNRHPPVSPIVGIHLSARIMSIRIMAIATFGPMPLYGHPPDSPGGLSIINSIAGPRRMRDPAPNRWDVHNWNWQDGNQWVSRIASVVDINRMRSSPLNRWVSRIGTSGVNWWMSTIGCCNRARGTNLTGETALGVEAPSGLEPLNRGFADLSLSHLGTAPL
jgi:hypothetical protein